MSRKKKNDDKVTNEKCDEREMIISTNLDDMF